MALRACRLGERHIILFIYLLTKDMVTRTGRSSVIPGLLRLTLQCGKIELKVTTQDYFLV